MSEENTKWYIKPLRNNSISTRVRMKTAILRANVIDLVSILVP